jgi:hypothetical protein
VSQNDVVVLASVEVNVSKGFLEALLSIGADAVEEIVRVFAGGT